jgi:2,5-diamino-6-(ribosylamino)-4(3H)-pyrimidinone 5'-phosphate reductase
MNAQFIRQGLIDNVRIVVAPLIVGGKDTPTLVDGESIRKIEDLYKLKSLKLRNCRVLKDSFLDLEYEVNN